MACLLDPRRCSLRALRCRYPHSWHNRRPATSSLSIPESRRSAGKGVIQPDRRATPIEIIYLTIDVYCYIIINRVNYATNVSCSYFLQCLLETNRRTVLRMCQKTAGMALSCCCYVIRGTHKNVGFSRGTRVRPLLISCKNSKNSESAVGRALDIAYECL